MKFALVNPSTPDGNIVPPIGLLSIAAVLEQGGNQVAFFDQNTDPDIVPGLCDFSPAAIGITAVTSSVLNARQLAARFRERLPEVTILFGGPHPSAMPTEVCGWPEVDFVVAGEGEVAVVQIAQWFDSKGIPAQLELIPNLYYRENGTIRHTFQAPFLTSEQLDTLPLPAYHLLNMKDIASRIRHGLFRKGKRVLPYMATRGCPHECAFCCGTMGRAIRRKKPQTVLADIEHLITAYNIDEVYFEDDNFTASKEFADAILSGIVQRHLGIAIKFANGMRADGVDEPMLAMLRRAGCYALSFGIESGSDKILRLMQKRLDLGKASIAVQRAQRMGFLTGANMIVGYPGETEDDIWQSFRYFQGLRLDSIAIVNCIPFPGTTVRKLCEEKGYLTELASCWNNYYFDIQDPKILIETELLPAQKLEKLLSQLFFKLYADPRRIMSLVGNMKISDVMSGVSMAIKRLGK